MDDPKTCVFAIPVKKIRHTVYEGVLVKSEGHGDIWLYFDKVSHLLIKREQKTFSFFDGEIALTEDYFLYNGAPQGPYGYSDIKTIQNGKKSWEATIVSVEYLDRVDPKLFAEPR